MRILKGLFVKIDLKKANKVVAIAKVEEDLNTTVEEVVKEDTDKGTAMTKVKALVKTIVVELRRV
ncbi:hypothetical protein [Clostridium sp. ZS1]|uniref:hypothetical protein n=1 Tax=Clostridium sp. ZS1 TaxID=2949989 RepID=UPI00207987D8|nr:hypothetical protein [Clostridium sp. ZS1]MBN1037670.1 hypothetical protein [Clostridium botulinum]